MQRIVLAALGLALALVTPAVGKDCDRACTLGVAEAVLEALQSGEPGKLLPRGFRMTENGRDIRTADSQLRAFRRISYLHAFADPVSGAAGFVGAAEAYGGPAVFSMRLLLKEGRATELEALVVRRTEASVFAPETMAGKAEWDAPLAPEQRSNRATLLAVANAFLDGLGSGAATTPSPEVTCGLYENGFRAIQPPTCNAIPSLRGAVLVRDRRWPVIDEERGLAWGIAVADIPDNADSVTGVRGARRAPRSLLISALFRIEAGKIRDIELVQRNVPLGAVSGWAPPKPKKAR